MDEARIARIENDLLSLKADVTEVKTSMAVKDERHKQVISRLDHIETTQDEYRKEAKEENKWNFRLLVSIFVGLFVTILTFFLKDGLGNAIGS